MPAARVHVALIAALDRNFAIGKGNALPWHLPDDLRRFKVLTLGKPVLMGRRTAEAIGRALPKRRNLVLTRAGRSPLAGMESVRSLDEAFDMARGGELCVIGGGEVYALAMPFARVLHLTHVDTEVTGADAFFPRFDSAAWRIHARESHDADGDHAFGFEFVEYRRG